MARLCDINKYFRGIVKTNDLGEGVVSSVAIPGSSLVLVVEFLLRLGERVGQCLRGSRRS